MIERLLIAGLGSMGARHVRLARQLLPDVAICVLRHRPVTDASSTDGVRYVSSLDDALAFDPQAAIIATPASKHLDSALPLARAGVHLLVEKPMAASSEGVQALVDAAAAQASTLMIAYNLRFSSSLQNFRARLLEGTIGRVLSVRAEVGQYLPDWRPQSDYRDTVSAQAALGGGALLELSHELDYLRWLFGDVSWVSATLTRQSAMDIDVEDTAHLVLAFAGERPVVANVDLDFVRRDSTRQCTVIGEHGTLHWNALAGTVEEMVAPATDWTVVSTSKDASDAAYLAQMQRFFDCVAGRESPMVSGDDGLAVMRIVDAARRSSQAGRRIDVQTFSSAVTAEGGG